MIMSFAVVGDSPRPVLEDLLKTLRPAMIKPKNSFVINGGRHRFIWAKSHGKSCAQKSACRIVPRWAILVVGLTAIKCLQTFCDVQTRGRS